MKIMLNAMVKTTCMKKDKNGMMEIPFLSFFKLQLSLSVEGRTVDMKT